MRATLVLGVLCLSGCVKRLPVQHTVTPLPNGRFVGPLEVKVPRRAEHEGHDFDLVVTLAAKCTPQVTLSWPDGEDRKFGDGDARWQDLLIARAKGETTTTTPTVAAPRPPPPPPPTPAPAPATRAPGGWQPMPGTAGAAVDAEVTLPLPQVRTGQWERRQTEHWKGQLEFEDERDERCETSRTWTAKYRNAFDETGVVAIWAEVPQELLDATLTVDVLEVIPPPKPAKVEPPPPAAPRPVKVAKVEPAKPIPPRPEPRKESPDAAKDPGARWQSGRWEWVAGQGEWVWYQGFWLQPPTAPGLKFEDTSAPPVPGCRWASGHWEWVGRDGHWEWSPGFWRSPPPKVEDRGTPPDPSAPWEAGYWESARGGSFHWVGGHWGRPPQRAETPGPAPRPGASWIHGDWTMVQGSWVWSPGFWEGTVKPPPPKLETPPAQPGAGAVWLSGFWRWDSVQSAHVWVAGHWELPPGENYVWVPDPVGAAGVVLRGHWELRVRGAP